jgi:ribosome biogenesis GTPase
VGDTSGDEGTLTRIVGLEERTSLLRRSADDTDQVERVVVANADQMLVVVAAADPEPRPRLVDRYLIAALDAGIHPSSS